MRPGPDAKQGGFVAPSPRVLRIKEIGRQVADTDAPVLILGPSGVGKEVLARYIHRQSRRAPNGFLKVNCAALPADLLEPHPFASDPPPFSAPITQTPA